VAATANVEYGDRVETQSKRILIVDDFAPWRRFLSTVLSVAPEWQVSGEVATGADALTQAQELQPDLVLLDIGLPDIDGLEVARQLKAIAPKAKIVFLTAESSSDLVKDALATGALGYVIKSQLVCELLPALASVFSGKRFISQGVTL
jgi:DNA-binding NarL/FixJ family response regulator